MLQPGRTAKHGVRYNIIYNVEMWKTFRHVFVHYYLEEDIFKSTSITVCNILSVFALSCCCVKYPPALISGLLLPFCHKPLVLQRFVLWCQYRKQKFQYGRVGNCGIRTQEEWKWCKFATPDSRGSFWELCALQFVVTCWSFTVDVVTKTCLVIFLGLNSFTTLSLEQSSANTLLILLVTQ